MKVVAGRAWMDTFLIISLESYQLFLLRLRSEDLWRRHLDLIDHVPALMGCRGALCLEQNWGLVLVGFVSWFDGQSLSTVEAQVFVRPSSNHLTPTHWLPHRNSRLLIIWSADTNFQDWEIRGRSASLPPQLPESFDLQQCLVLPCEILRPVHDLSGYEVCLLRILATLVWHDNGGLLLVRIVIVALQ